MMLSPTLPSFLLVASAAVLVSAQGQPAAASGCTTNSFTIPSWFVQDVAIAGEGASQTVSFSVLNRATNGTTTVACTSGGACTAGDKDLEALADVGDSSVHILVSQTWGCNDRVGADRLKFTAVGNGTLPLQASKASISPFLIRGSLISPINVNPVYMDGPTGHDTKGCTTDSPSWIVDAVEYQDQTGDGVSSFPSKRLNFQVTNPATGYEASCMSAISDDDAATATTIPVTCGGIEFQNFGIGRYSISTRGSLSLPSYTLSLSQTWYCSDVDPSKPVSITGTGTLPLPLTCETAPSYGNTTQTTCTAASRVTVPGTVTATTQLAPYSITDPTPQARDGCTLSSLFDPQWRFSSFVVDETKTPAAVEFNLILQAQGPGFQGPITISQGAAVAGAAGWFRCVVGPDGELAPPLWPETCQFKYDGASGEFLLDAEWKCRDLDPERPVLFSGTTKTKVESPLGCKIVGEYLECESDSTIAWTAKIDNVTLGPLP
ncbi:hypothetical protein QBC39DRAFT_382765 [Podospora conica]|nr:hypothetical protein QBC39DRAFT_382765 [Schizothecium conicum]